MFGETGTKIRGYVGRLTEKTPLPIVTIESPGQVHFCGPGEERHRRVRVWERPPQLCAMTLGKAFLPPGLHWTVKIGIFLAMIWPAPHLYPSKFRFHICNFCLLSKACATTCLLLCSSEGVTVFVLRDLWSVAWHSTP